jgi:hypothetical protein
LDQRKKALGTLPGAFCFNACTRAGSTPPASIVRQASSEYGNIPNHGTPVGRNSVEGVTYRSKTSRPSRGAPKSDK